MPENTCTELDDKSWLLMSIPVGGSSSVFRHHFVIFARAEKKSVYTVRSIKQQGEGKMPKNRKNNTCIAVSALAGDSNS